MKKHAGCRRKRLGGHSPLLLIISLVNVSHGHILHKNAILLPFYIASRVFILNLCRFDVHAPDIYFHALDILSASFE